VTGWKAEITAPVGPVYGHRAHQVALQRREAAACGEAEEMRGQIACLSERLAEVEERLSRLVVARETVDELVSEAGPAVVTEETARRMTSATTRRGS
jgi:hypothetical protein